MSSDYNTGGKIQRMATVIFVLGIIVAVVLLIYSFTLNVQSYGYGGEITSVNVGGAVRWQALYVAIAGFIPYYPILGLGKIVSYVERCEAKLDSDEQEQRNNTWRVKMNGQK